MFGKSGGVAGLGQAIQAAARGVGGHGQQPKGQGAAQDQGQTEAGAGAPYTLSQGSNRVQTIDLGGAQGGGEQTMAADLRQAEAEGLHRLTATVSELLAQPSAGHVRAALTLLGHVRFSAPAPPPSSLTFSATCQVHQPLHGPSHAQLNSVPATDQQRPAVQAQNEPPAAPVLGGTAGAAAPASQHLAWLQLVVDVFTEAWQMEAQGELRDRAWEIGQHAGRAALNFPTSPASQVCGLCGREGA